jgi:phosphoenolpyruvate carboxykinase (ATP)
LYFSRTFGLSGVHRPGQLRLVGKVNIASMGNQTERARGLAAVGIIRSGPVHWNLGAAELYEHAIRREEAVIAADGPLVCLTGQHTGRSPNDKFFVRDTSTEALIDWGSVNREIDAVSFDRLHEDMVGHLADKALYVLDAWAGADQAYRLSIRVVTELAWHNLFARNMFIAETDQAKLRDHEPSFTVVDVPSFRADPARHGTRSAVFILVNVTKRIILIGGTSYAGEIKKSIFTALNYLLPQQDVLPMHCSANIGSEGDTALFFGLSGTGKTTLSSDPLRRLVGDDEHGWSERGIFNFEGGCYAKAIKLSAEDEPQIYSTTRRFGTVLENVVVDPVTRALDLDDGTLTENTRASYPIAFIDNAVPSGEGGHPKNVVMLTADAYGVLPPIARLTPDGAAYHFLSGYTARLAGTEKGVTEPKAAFSACFGAPFLPLRPNVYAGMLSERIATHGAHVWLVNTGWTGGPYGEGRRMKIGYTRAMIAAALDGRLAEVEHRRDPIFNLDVPVRCPDVPTAVLVPRTTWADGDAYDMQARRLAAMFIENFKSFEADVSPSVTAAGPKS